MQAIVEKKISQSIIIITQTIVFQLQNYVYFIQKFY